MKEGTNIYFILYTVYYNCKYYIYENGYKFTRNVIVLYYMFINGSKELAK